MFHPVPRTDRWDPLLVAAAMALLALGLAAMSLIAS
jgi:hypothetical protein